MPTLIPRVFPLSSPDPLCAVSTKQRRAVLDTTSSTSESALLTLSSSVPILGLPPPEESSVKFTLTITAVGVTSANTAGSTRSTSSTLGSTASRTSGSTARSTSGSTESSTLGSTASSTSGSTEINPNQLVEQHAKPSKIIPIAVGIAVPAVLGLLVILLVYCRRRKRQLTGNDSRIANPYTESVTQPQPPKALKAPLPPPPPAPPPPPISQPLDPFETAQRYIYVLEGQIETMRREVAALATTTNAAPSQAGLTTPEPSTIGKPERVESLPKYEPV
ncbi:hypothetical protein JR316_0004345 [Psilocybe cubensis]|uniref:Uncharacterized protein n=1 Tax=Psilocybe cubensis TaxID=181762 RepID=A0ACB8H3L8_PSICU|nr:hypothetical protein JR316_0004345 [Psilocybe cubensis]KAH9482247.1 hypothetical protein JR316_0004345 [Psilocybe cubensis]